MRLNIKTALVALSGRFIRTGGALIIISVIFFASSLSAKELRISTLGFAPPGFIGKDNKPTDITYEIANQIDENANLKYINTIKPYARVLLELENGTTDLSILYGNKRLAGKVVELAPLYTDSNVIIAKRGKPIQSLSDLHGKKVATVRNANYSNVFDADTSITKVGVKNYNQGIRMLLHGRGDAFIGAAGSISFEFKASGNTWSEVSKPYVLNTKVVWLQVSKKSYNQDLAEKLLASIAQLKQQGVFKAILTKFLGDHGPYTSD